MVPEDLNASGAESKSLGESNNAESFASIQKPDLADDEEAQHLLIWGRFWGESEDLAVAFAINLNLDENRFVDEQYLLHQDPEKLDPFDPDQHYSRFKRTFDDKRSDTKLPQSTLPKVKNTFRNYLDSSDKRNKIVNALKNKDRETFSGQAYEIVNRIIPKGEVINQFKAELSTFNSEQSTSNDKDGKNPSKEDEVNRNEEEQNFLQVTPVTSPMAGEFPKDLKVGNSVYVRIMGEIVDQLPDNLQSENHDDFSTPIEASVRSISGDVDLPDNFDGNEQDYWELTVHLMDSSIGQSFVHKDTQIKTAKDENNPENAPMISPFTLVSSGIILLGLITLAYLIFGI